VNSIRVDRNIPMKMRDDVTLRADVYPNGLAFNVAEGCIRARYRKSILKPELVTLGEIYEYLIDLAANSNVFSKGHRIRIDITSSNFPRFERNMNTGNPFGEDATGISAMQTIYHQSGYASYIDLPVIPLDKGENNLDSPVVVTNSSILAVA
jgi:putative CocE/NonD family hydrolase